MTLVLGELGGVPSGRRSVRGGLAVGGGKAPPETSVAQIKEPQPRAWGLCRFSIRMRERGAKQRTFPERARSAGALRVLGREKANAGRLDSRG